MPSLSSLTFQKRLTEPSMRFYTVGDLLIYFMKVSGSTMYTKNCNQIDQQMVQIAFCDFLSKFQNQIIKKCPKTILLILYQCYNQHQY